MLLVVVLRNVLGWGLGERGCSFSFTVNFSVGFSYLGFFYIICEMVFLDWVIFEVFFRLYFLVLGGSEIFSRVDE